MWGLLESPKEEGVQLRESPWVSVLTLTSGTPASHGHHVAGQERTQAPLAISRKNSHGRHPREGEHILQSTLNSPKVLCHTNRLLPGAFSHRVPSRSTFCSQASASPSPLRHLWPRSVMPQPFLWALLANCMPPAPPSTLHPCALSSQTHCCVSTSSHTCLASAESVTVHHAVSWAW